MVTQSSVAFRARGGAKRINQRVAYVCAAGARPELHVQTRPRWRKCRVGARACVYARAGARAYDRVHARSRTDARIAKGCVHKRIMDMHCPSTRVGSEIGTVF